jgi:hypothetical protein
MFNKDTYDEIKVKIREINKLKTAGERLTSYLSYYEGFRGRLNDELEELFSTINLKKSREED